MSRINIFQETETNPFYDPSRSRNGGGYHQPKYGFLFGAWCGTFHDTSCGDFGTRYTLTMTNTEEAYHAAWGSMYDDWESNFPEQFPEPNFYKAFEEIFDEKIPTESEV